MSHWMHWLNTRYKNLGCYNIYSKGLQGKALVFWPLGWLFVFIGLEFVALKCKAHVQRIILLETSHMVKLKINTFAHSHLFGFWVFWAIKYLSGTASHWGHYGCKLCIAEWCQPWHASSKCKLKTLIFHLKFLLWLPLFLGCKEYFLLDFELIVLWLVVDNHVGTVFMQQFIPQDLQSLRSAYRIYFSISGAQNKLPSTLSCFMSAWPIGPNPLSAGFTLPNSNVIGNCIHHTHLIYPFFHVALNQKSVFCQGKTPHETCQRIRASAVSVLAKPKQTKPP
jgi:hypothetical protein